MTLQRVQGHGEQNRTMIHRSVLLNEIVSNLSLSKGDLVVDGTLGAGGHSRALCEKFPGIRIIGIDVEERAVREANKSFQGLGCETHFIRGNFRNMDAYLEKEKANAVILDLGISSDQLEDSGRGFSFMKDEPLLMTMKENLRPEDLTARDVVNHWSEENLAKIIRGFGEERNAKKIARAIVATRAKAPIETTLELLGVIEGAVGRRGRINPATKTFQALRIAVNDELGALKEGLAKGFEVLKPGGRMLAISFHSLEDRIVKNFYKEKTKENKGILINKKPILPSEAEIKENPRARSAKLRVIEKITV